MYSFHDIFLFMRNTDLSIFCITDCIGSITAKGDVLIKIEKAKKKMISTEIDAIQLSIFSHRFMSLAEQMGRYVFWCLKNCDSYLSKYEWFWIGHIITRFSGKY